MLKKVIIPIIIFALAIAFFKVMISSKDKSPAIEINEHVWRVDQSIVQAETLAPAMSLYGKVESSELLNVAAPLASQVVKVLIKEGQTIEKDQLMLALDDKDFLPLIRQSEAKVNELNGLIKSEKLRHEVNLLS